MVFEGGLCLPRAVFTAPSEARAVIRPKGGKGRPRRPFLSVHGKITRGTWFLPVMMILYFLLSHILPSWRLFGPKSVKNRTKIGSKSDKNSFFIISRSCRPFWVPTCLLLKKKSKNRFYRRTVNRRAKITSFLDFRVYKASISWM